MRWVRSALAPGIAVAAAAAFGICLKLRLGGPAATSYLDDAATAAAALAAFVLCVRAALRTRGTTRRFWALFAAALGWWTAGETAWAVYDLGFGRVPKASFADAFYLTAVPFCVAALLVHPALRGRALGCLRSLADGCIVALSVFLVAWLLVLEPMRHTTDLTSLGGLVSTAYPVTDTVIVVLIVLVVRGTTTHERHDIWLLLAGLVLMTASDAVYCYLNSVKHFATGGVIDTGWFAAYLAIGLGALRAHAYEPAAARARSELSPLALVTPLATVVAGLGLVATRLRPGHPLGGVTEVTTLVLVGLVLLRQSLLVLDAAREREGRLGTRLVGALGGTRR